MDKVALIYGLPGVGKTAIVQGLVQDMPLITEPFAHHTNGSMVILGDYTADTPFLGTDKLSMSVQPLAIDFIKGNASKYFIIEGDRLFNRKFIEAIDPVIIIIDAPKEEIKKRRLYRGVEQDSTFLEAKRTKLENIRNNYDHFELKNINPSDTLNCRLSILEILMGTTTIPITKKILNNLFDETF